MNKTESKEQPSAQGYMDLGPGEVRIGERRNPPPQSHYREVKNQEDDAPPKHFSDNIDVQSHFLKNCSKICSEQLFKSD